MTSADGSEAAPDAASADAASASPGRKRRGRWLAEIGLFVAMYAAMASFQGRDLLPTGAPAPAFSLRALDGTQVSLQSLRGKRTLVHFWATWCGVCRQEFGTLNALSRGLGPDEALVAIASDSEDAARLRDFATREHLEYRILLGDDSVVKRYRVGAFPTNYFLTRDGRIASRTVGMSTRWSFAARLALAR